MALAHIEMPLSGRHGAGRQTLVSVDDYDLVRDRKVSTASHGYAQIFVGGPTKEVSTLHRVIMRRIVPLDPASHVDHINRNKLDNRRENLRPVSQSNNQRNRAASRGPFTRNTVATRGGKWTARVKTDGRLLHLGTWPTQRIAWAVAELWKRQNIVGYLPQES